MQVGQWSNGQLVKWTERTPLLVLLLLSMSTKYENTDDFPCNKERREIKWNQRLLCVSVKTFNPGFLSVFSIKCTNVRTITVLVIKQLLVFRFQWLKGHQTEQENQWWKRGLKSACLCNLFLTTGWKKVEGGHQTKPGADICFLKISNAMRSRVAQLTLLANWQAKTRKFPVRR